MSRHGIQAPTLVRHFHYLRREADGSSNGHVANGSAFNDTKEGGALDWYTEGPGRRVGYDDLTAIDWIFEYTKERQRLRYLYSKATGLVGYAQQVLDASQIWIILIATGVAAGVLAASIDVASDWLGDLKTGFCKTGSGGGNFWLNRGFCCWGHDEWAQCQGWTAWGRALRIKSNAGQFIVEYIFFLVFSVAFAAAASLLVQRYATYAKHSGIPEIKTVLGGFVMRRFMGGWTLLTKSLGLCLAVASGLWLGKEGPLVHVACCCANLFMKLSPSLNENEARKREVLSAAAAAGISVAFGSPIGGVLFSLEQLSYYFPDKTMWQSFVCAMVAAVTLQAFNPFRTGKLVLYQVTYSTGWHGFELIPYGILGILGGIYGGLFIKLNMRVAKWRQGSRWAGKPILEVIAVTVITAVLNFPNKFMRAQSSELVYMLFAECATITDDQFGICKTGSATAGVILLLLQAAVIGFLLASITFGLQIPAGIILPSMAIGGLTGRAVGVIMEIWHHDHPNAIIFATCEPDIPCITPGTYAIIGAAAALAGVTRMTVSIVVIMFELTGALTYVLPIMIAVMISKWVGDAFGKRGIYESWIHFNEYPFLDNRDDSPGPDVPVSQVMTQLDDLAVLSATGHTVQSLHDFLSAQPYRGFPVVVDATSNILLGYVSRTELLYSLQTATTEPRNLPPSTSIHFIHNADADPRDTLDLRPWMDQTPITLNSKSSLQLTISMFSKLGLRYVLFTDRGALRGLLTKKDVWYVLDGAEDDSVGTGGGVLREEQGGESRGLLNREDSDRDSFQSPMDER
ncbi:MAG: chloride channel [Ramalina farinacea]|uniref:Chloride channel protein n=1 Tax=Ramalina farinacea TaxID=258253 RepID=A0AA43QP34_9LECA|nr:chloride channel [Ramalina farinacea]